MSSASGVTWNLDTLYRGAGDPRLVADLADAVRDAQAFAARYRGRVATLDAPALAEAITAFEAIEERARGPTFYAQLRFAADTQDEAAKTLGERTRERWVEIVNTLTFFELELKALPDEPFARVTTDPGLASARHWLGRLRRLRTHTLGEAEEQLLNRKNLTGREALARLFDELSGSLRFPVEVDGALRELTGEETLALLHHPDRGLRKRAYTAFLDAFAAHRVVLTSVFNALLHDHRLDCELRRFPDPMAPTHLDNEVRPETVEAMMTATERHYPLAQRYFRLKAKLLGLARLQNTDLYAPLGSDVETIGFDDARTLVLDAFAGFSPAFADRARDFFTERWIDAEPRRGKRLGAFCATHGPGSHPWVLLSYTDTPRDVATLAHELGHGVHDCLAARQRPLDFSPPLTLAETASTFAEMVLTQHLLAREQRPAVRRALLCAKIEDTIATVFRQNVLTRFEMAAHARRGEGPLSADALCDLWRRENARLYGDVVEMIPAYGWGWSYIPHFIHSRFYCYAYVFGELLVLALYRRFRAEGPAFVPHYLALLGAGGSDAPDALLRRIGVEIDAPGFWDQGFAVLASLIDELEGTG